MHVKNVERFVFFSVSYLLCGSFLSFTLSVFNQSRAMRLKARGLAQHGRCDFVPNFVSLASNRTGCSNMSCPPASWWNGISSWCFIVNVHNHPSWATTCKEGMAWYSIRPMPSLWLNQSRSMRPKPKGLTQRGGPPGWLEDQSDPAGCDFVWLTVHAAHTLTDHSACPGLKLLSCKRLAITAAAAAACLFLNVHKQEAWWKSHMAYRVISPLTHSASLVESSTRPPSVILIPPVPWTK